jgi:hypothetical protein
MTTTTVRIPHAILRFEQDTGSGSLASSYSADVLTKIESVLLTLASTPTDAEDFRIFLDDAGGSTKDTTAFAFDLASGSVPYAAFLPEGLYVKPGDALGLTFTNSGSLAFAATTIMKEITA